MKTTQRKQFTFYRSYIENVMKLPKCRRFETLLGIIFYALDGAEPALCGASDAVFGCIRPNIDSSRVRAERCLRAQRDEEAAWEAAALPGIGQSAAGATEKASSQEEEKKIKIESESEEERENQKEKEIESETETEIEAELQREGSAGPDAGGVPPRQAARAGYFGLSLSAGERKSNDFFPEEPEEQPLYAGMLEDPCLRVLWRSLVDRGSGGRPLGRSQKQRLLGELLSTPPPQRSALLTARLKAPDSPA